jgi:hypothetical protein
MLLTNTQVGEPRCAPDTASVSWGGGRPPARQHTQSCCGPSAGARTSVPASERSDRRSHRHARIVCCGGDDATGRRTAAACHSARSASPGTACPLAGRQSPRQCELPVARITRDSPSDTDAKPAAVSLRCFLPTPPSKTKRCLATPASLLAKNWRCSVRPVNSNGQRPDRTARTTSSVIISLRETSLTSARFVRQEWIHVNGVMAQEMVLDDGVGHWEELPCLLGDPLAILRAAFVDSLPNPSRVLAHSLAGHHRSPIAGRRHPLSRETRSTIGRWVLRYAPHLHFIKQGDRTSRRREEAERFRALFLVRFLGG